MYKHDNLLSCFQVISEVNENEAFLEVLHFLRESKLKLFGMSLVPEDLAKLRHECMKRGFDPSRL